MCWTSVVVWEVRPTVWPANTEVHVHGIDLSENMIRIAKTRLKEEGLQHLVTLEQGNCLEMQTETTFNVVHSRDVFLHIKDKARLFRSNR